MNNNYDSNISIDVKDRFADFGKTPPPPSPNLGSISSGINAMSRKIQMLESQTKTVKKKSNIKSSEIENIENQFKELRDNLESLKDKFFKQIDGKNQVSQYNDDVKAMNKGLVDQQAKLSDIVEDIQTLYGKLAVKSTASNTTQILAQDFLTKLTDVDLLKLTDEKNLDTAIAEKFPNLLNKDELKNEIIKEIHKQFHSAFKRLGDYFDSIFDKIGTKNFDPKELMGLMSDFTKEKEQELSIILSIFKSEAKGDIKIEELSERITEQIASTNDSSILKAIQGLSPSPKVQEKLVKSLNDRFSSGKLSAESFVQLFKVANEDLQLALLQGRQEEIPKQLEKYGPDNIFYIGEKRWDQSKKEYHLLETLLKDPDVFNIIAASSDELKETNQKYMTAVNDNYRNNLSLLQRNNFGLKSKAAQVLHWEPAEWKDYSKIIFSPTQPVLFPRMDFKNLSSGDFIYNKKVSILKEPESYIRLPDNFDIKRLNNCMKVLTSTNASPKTDSKKYLSPKDLWRAGAFIQEHADSQLKAQYAKEIADKIFDHWQSYPRKTRDKVDPNYIESALGGIYSVDMGPIFNRQEAKKELDTYASSCPEIVAYLNKKLEDETLFTS